MDMEKGEGYRHEKREGKKKEKKEDKAEMNAEHIKKAMKMRLKK